MAAKAATEKEQLSLQTAKFWDVIRGWCDEVTAMRSALAYAEQHSAVQVQSDAQSAAALRSELQTALVQLSAEMMVCRAAHQREADATNGFTAQVSRFKDKFEERERALLHELAVQKDEFRQLQVKVAAVRPPLLLEMNAAASNRVAP